MRTLQIKKSYKYRMWEVLVIKIWNQFQVRGKHNKVSFVFILLSPHHYQCYFTTRSSFLIGKTKKSRDGHVFLLRKNLMSALVKQHINF